MSIGKIGMKPAFANILVLALLFGGLAACAWSGAASAQGATLLVTVTPTEFQQNAPVTVTVVATNAFGNPVSNASVYFYTVDVGAYSPASLQQVHQNPGPVLGVTDAAGTFTTTYTPAYGKPMHLFVQVRSGSDMALKDFPLKDKSGGGFDAMGALKKYGFIMACLIVVPVTLGGWYSSTTNTKKIFEDAKLKGFHKKFEDPDSGADSLKHPESEGIFKSFKEGLRDTKDSKLFITGKLLNSFEIENVNMHYAGLVRGDEEVEYFSTEVKEQRISDGFKLHADPKPTPPSKFTAEDDVQVFPISEKVADCGRCHASGQITCDKCKGDAKKTCPTCSGSGKSWCEKCGGTGWYSYNINNTQWTSRAATIDEKIRNAATKCERCNGTGKGPCILCKGVGYFPCEKCGGTGKMTCTLCMGDRQTRHLTCKVWRYKHEKLRQVHGHEGQTINPDRLEEIDKTIQPGPSLDDSAAAPTYPGEDKDATPFIRAIVDSSRNSYKTWKGRAKGRVVLDKHELLLSPVTGLEIAYPAKGEEKTFKIWALGNNKAYVLDAGETPTQLTARYAARHAAFALVVLGELAFFAYAQIYWHVLW